MYNLILIKIILDMLDVHDSYNRTFERNVFDTTTK